MSLIGKTTNNKQILDKLCNIEALLQQLLNSGKRGPKIKSKMVKYARDETKYDDIYIIPDEDNELYLNIILITKNKDGAPVIKLTAEEFKKFADTVAETKINKSVSIKDYSTSDDTAVRVEDEWIIS